MKKEGEANKSKAIEDGDNGVALTEDEHDAAFVLLYLKYYVKLDDKTALELDSLKRKILEGKDRQDEEPSSDIHGTSEILESFQTPDVPGDEFSSRPYQKRGKSVRFLFKKNQNQESLVIPQPQDENVAKKTLTPEDPKGEDNAMRERSLSMPLRWRSSRRRSNRVKLSSEMRDEEQSNRCCVPEYSYGIFQLVESKVKELISSLQIFFSSDPCSTSKPFLFPCKTAKKEREKNKSTEIGSGERWWTDEECSAAEALVSFQHAKLEKQSALKLKKRKREFLKGDGEQEQEEQVLDDYEPPDIPPVAALAGLVSECSKPYQKRLTETDLKRDQLRFLFCKDHVREFMIPLLKEDENVGNGIPVTVYDSEGNEYDMKFKLWGLNAYVLNGTGWIRFCQQHGLVKYIDIVTVWMFRQRVTRKLCFAITTRRSRQHYQQLANPKH
ncbi:hypothetical protein V6N11_045268 [Hibiscus sabdariffa]|uniref:TF-B3 domain-containing protein n=1 Tax=Hibiscus sabdariffa TaxID=183260 RepID=A0ABR2Q0K7_9ROSI